MSGGVFRPSGATPWSSYNTPRIWAMVEGEDDPESWRQVAALGSLAGLLNDQRKRLELAIRSLMDAWPPERNRAAAAFVEVAEDLLLTMRENKAVADSNAGALGQVVEALRRAKVEIGPLYRSYVEKSDDWIPGWWDRAEEQLDREARERMRAAEMIVADPGNAIRAPDLYEFRPRTILDGRVGGPPRGEEAPGIAVPHDPPPPVPGSEAPERSSGPELAGVIGPPPSSGPPAASVTSSGPAVPGLIIGGGPPGGVVGPVGADQRGWVGSATKPVPPSWLPPVPGRRAQVRDPIIPPPSMARSRRHPDDSMAFDPDNPWATDQGVAPVIEPSRKWHRHDPGRGVIG